MIRMRAAIFYVERVLATSGAKRGLAWARSPIGRRILDMLATRGGITAISAVSAIWAARCLGPVNLGISAAVFSATLQVLLFINLNQDTHLIREFKQCPSDEEKKRLINQVLSFRAITGTAVTLLSGIVLILLWRADAIAPAWERAIMCGLALMFFGSFSALWIFHGQERQHIDVRMALVASVVTLAGYAIWLRPNATASDLLLVMAASQCIVAVISWGYCLGDGYSPRVSFTEYKRFFPVMRRGKWLFATGIFSSAYVYMAAPLLVGLSSEKDAGHYRGAEQLVGAITPFFQVIGTIMYPKFVTLASADPSRIWHTQLAWFRMLLIVSVAIMTVSVLLCRPLIHLALGEAYAESAVPFSILLFARIINLLAGVFLWSLYARGFDKLLFGIIVVCAVSSLALNIFLIPKFGVVGAAFVSVFGESLIFCAVYLVCRHIAFRKPVS